MSPKDQKTMQQIYAFIDLQEEILKADRRSGKVRKEIHSKIAKLMRIASTVRRSGGLRFLGGVDPVETTKVLKEMVAA